MYFDNAVETRHSDVWRLLQYGADGEAKGSGFQADELEKKPRRLLHEKKAAFQNTFVSQKYKFDLIEGKADVLLKWPLLNDVDQIGKAGIKDDVSRWRQGYKSYFKHLFSAHDGELIVLRDGWQCMGFADIYDFFFHEQFALNQEQWQETNNK